MAGIVCLFDVLDVYNSTQSRNITKLVDCLVNSSTVKPIQKTLVMPVWPFLKLLIDWEGNETLPIENLLLKVICLLALVLMLWPSDISPRAQVPDQYSLIIEQVAFGEDQVQFHEDGSFSLAFHGMTNECKRGG